MIQKNNLKYLVLATIVFSLLVLSGYYIGLDHESANNTNKSLPNNQSLDNPILEDIFLPENDQNDANSGGDAGSTLPLATPINPGDYNGTLIADDEDYYSFSIEAGVIINMTMIPYNLSINFDLTIYDESFTPIAFNYKEAGIRETIIYSSTSAGNYSASILPNSVDQVGNYSFALSLINQNDFNSTKDAGNQLTTALEISYGNASGTFVWGSDYFDFYKLELTQGDIVNIDVKTQNTSNIDLFFVGPNSEILKSSEKLIGLNEQIYYAISEDGSYRIWLELIDNIDANPIIYYNLNITLFRQNDASSNTDAGNTHESSLIIYPLTASIFQGKLVWDGDIDDFYQMDINTNSDLVLRLTVPDNANFDLFVFDGEKNTIHSADQISLGATESVILRGLQNDTYYINVHFESGLPVNGLIEGEYILEVSLYEVPVSNGNGGANLSELIPLILSSVLVPIFLIVILIFVLYLFTDVRIPWVSNKLDRYFSKEGKGETVKSLKYALRVRDETIDSLREDLIEKDSKRAKDLEKIHRLEEDQKSKEKVLAKLREEGGDLKTRLENLNFVNDDLANIIDSTIRRQLSKSSKSTQKAKVSTITSLLWLSEERLKNYIDSIPLLNERYILDKSKNFIITKDHAREIVRKAYWKRVGAMHLKKVKQVKVHSLSDDTNIDIDTIKMILRELVERKEIPAPIHMDKESLLLSISEDLISEITELAQSTAILSLNEISKSYNTTKESARIIFNKISEEGYVNGEFIDDDKFVVFDLFIDAIVSQASVDIYKFAEEHNLKDEEEEVKILIEKELQEGKLEGVFLTDEMFLCFNNLTDQLKELIRTSVEDLERGDTRRVVFDIGSVVESIVKQSLIIDIHELQDVDKLPSYQDVVESKELGKIIRAAEEEKITLPSFIELKSINRYWAQKIKHTKPGELPYIPSIEEARLFLFESNRSLNKMLEQKMPTKWKLRIAKNLLK